MTVGFAMLREALADAGERTLSTAFIVGIPAIPWFMPFLLGVVALHRSADEPNAAPMRAQAVA